MRESFEDFFAGYVAAAIRSSAPDGEQCDAAALAPELVEEMRDDCAAFWNANAAHIMCDGGQAAVAGRDFWLTRCGHGAGFRGGEWPEAHADALDRAARAFASMSLYIGDDGQRRDVLLKQA